MPAPPPRIISADELGPPIVTSVHVAPFQRQMFAVAVDTSMTHTSVGDDAHTLSRYCGTAGVDISDQVEPFHFAREGPPVDTLRPAIHALFASRAQTSCAWKSVGSGTSENAEPVQWRAFGPDVGMAQTSFVDDPARKPMAVPRGVHAEPS